MAAANLDLIHALRITADSIAAGQGYKWSNYGMCNCGTLAQTVTKLSAKEIQEAAIARSEGDWGQQARDFCGDTGLHMDHILQQLLDLGLSPTDIDDLERLRNPKVRARMPEGTEPISHYTPVSVVAYMRAWADLLEERLQAQTRLAAK